MEMNNKLGWKTNKSNRSDPQLWYEAWKRNLMFDSCRCLEHLIVDSVLHEEKLSQILASESLDMIGSVRFKVLGHIYYRKQQKTQENMPIS